MLVDIDLTTVQTGEEFHDLFAAALGLGAEYGRNMSAWADALRSADATASPIGAQPGELVTLRIAGMGALKLSRPDIHDALLEAAALVNHRRLEVGTEPNLALAYA